MTSKKPHEENNPEDVVVHIVFVSSKYPELGEYECAGVLIRDEKDMVRVCFNAKINVVKDYLDIQRVDILSIDIVSPESIEKI